MSIFLRLRVDGWYVVTNGKICFFDFGFCWSNKKSAFAELHLQRSPHYILQKRQIS